MIKAIIFDFFDVIRSDSYHSWLRAHGFVREGIFHEVSQRLDAGKISLEEFFETLSKQSGEPVTLENFEANAKVNQNVIEIVKQLRRKFTTALLSNAPSALIRDILERNDLEKYFDEIIVSSEVGHIKPNKEIFELTLSKLGIKPHEAIFIDDNKHNIEGSEKVGIRGFHFVTAEQLKKELIRENLL